MTIKTTIFQLTTLALLLICQARASAAVQRYGITRGDKTLTVEILSDTLLHFELAPTAEKSPATAPVPHTPYVVKDNFAGPTETATASVNDQTLCVSVNDKAQSGEPLTTICPLSGNDEPGGLSIEKEETENIYGLGEEFLNLGEANGDWMGKVRSSPSPFGNALVAFGGGAVGNAQFPIMYAVGRQSNYAIFLDHAQKQTWNFQTNPWTVETGGKILRWYMILGKNLPSLRTQYMDLVGHATVPPKKIFGLWISEFGYRNWPEIDDKLSTLRKHRFPVDGFILDVYWYGPFTQNSETNNFGHMAWDEKNFPDPSSYIKHYHDDEGLGLALSEGSYINHNLQEYGILATHGFLVRSCSTCAAVPLESWWGKSAMIDWTNTEATRFWHDWKRQPLVDAGIVYHWADLGEPETYSASGWFDGLPGVEGHGESEMHNFYSFKWIEGIADGYARHSQRRPYVLARSGTSGIQRFGGALWSGDIGSNLRSLSSHLNAQMELSMSGLDYFGCDVGGFHREALEGNMDDVYTRWFAHSAAFDFPLRPHTDNGSKKNPTAPDRIGDLKSNLYNVRQRYELSPYYYSIAHRAYLTGEPLVPPLVYYYQNDPNVRKIGDEKLIGRNLLFATAAHDGEKERSVYLPEGEWINYHTLKWHKSAGEWLANVPEFDHGVFRLPLFARAGAIIPKMFVDDKTQNILGRRSDRSRADELIVRVFAASRPSSFKLYEDDGESIEYKSGAVATTKITQRLLDGRLEVNVLPTDGTYRGMSPERGTQVEAIIRNGFVTSVQLGGKDLRHQNTLRDFMRARDGWYFDGQVTYAKARPLPVRILKTFSFAISAKLKLD